jgi:hypothetical protein
LYANSLSSLKTQEVNKGTGYINYIPPSSLHCSTIKRLERELLFSLTALLLRRMSMKGKKHN